MAQKAVQGHHCARLTAFSASLVLHCFVVTVRCTLCESHSSRLLSDCRTDKSSKQAAQGVLLPIMRYTLCESTLSRMLSECCRAECKSTVASRETDLEHSQQPVHHKHQIFVPPPL